MMVHIREKAFIIVFDSYMKLTLYTPTQCEYHDRTTTTLQPTAERALWSCDRKASR